MTLCLQHPTLGYYTTKKVFGSVGDFITSPEISQIFGELLAIWYVTQWVAQGLSPRVRIVELGPGKGTLLADILRTFKALPSHSSPPVTSIHLIETSDAMRAEQKGKLERAGFAAIETHWWGSVDEVPKSEDEFTVIVAHEFFDALPIHVFENTPKGWREVMVDVADPKSIIVSSTPRVPLRLVLSPNPTPASTMYTRMSTIASSPPPNSNISSSLSFDTTLPPPPPPSPSPSTEEGTPPISQTLSRFARLPVGSRMEISPACWEVARGVGNLLQGPKGGAGLVVDYGDEKAFGRSWRGFRKHQIVDPLSEPGHTDLTANVDFSYLAEAMSDLVISHGPLTQSDFLTSLGLQPRLEGLLRKATDERRGEIESAAKSASKDSLKTLHLHLFPNVEEVKLCPALTDIGPHLPALVLDTDPWEILENSLDIFPIFKSLRSFSWNGLGRFDPLTADHTGNLGTILDAFPSPATLTHLSVGTEDFFSLAHITPLLSHPTLALLTKLDLPSLPSSTPAEQASDVAAMAKACEERGIQWTVGGVAQ
ncbi:hypothetical protein RQP46_009680 [Phenoliferia psychrophenolica]